MVNETDLSQELRSFYEERANRVIGRLQKVNINAVYTPTRDEALAAVMGLIPEGVRVARGDSVTVDQVGVMAEIRRRNRNQVIDPFERDAEGRLLMEGNERRQAMRQAFLADVFIAGANAITLDGKVVSIDALGNRVAPVIFGPDKVILVIGANKIVKDLESALKRIHDFVVPMNARRIVFKRHFPEYERLPCVVTGVCADCNHEWRLCRCTVIIEGATVREKGRINIVLVGEELGI